MSVPGQRVARSSPARRAALTAFAALSAACGREAGGGGGPPAYTTSYGLTIERTTEESLRGEVSHVVERTVGHLTWTEDSAGIAARLRVDSVAFTRDGAAKRVAPDRRPVAELGMHRARAGSVVLDALPDDVEAYPYLATVALDLPAVRPVVAPGACRPGAVWADSGVVGPVPVPGVDSLVSTYHTRYHADSLAGGSLLVHARTDVCGVGRTGGAVALTVRAHRVGTWRLAGGCRGPASVVETARDTLIYPDVRGRGPDTVTTSERRVISVTGRP